MSEQAEAKKPEQQQEGDGLIDKLVAINRTAKVVKGGRNFSFTALVVVGDGNGRVGFGKGKAKEVTDARKKASDAARKNMVRIPLREGRTLHHDIKSRAGAGYVTLRSAPSGTGIIAGGPMRAVFEALGVKDVVAKSTGSSNPFNMVRATFTALQDIQSPKATAERLGKTVGDIVARREGAGTAANVEYAEEAAKAEKKAPAKKPVAKVKKEAEAKADDKKETAAKKSAAKKAPAKKTTKKES